MRAVIILAISLVAASPALASESGCRVVHGRMSLTNGTPSIRIWVIGTHRLLGVVQQDQSFGDLPAGIRSLWAARGEGAMWSSHIFGDFRVCPMSKGEFGSMQMVRVQEATNLRLR
jgi:hypothetical protein